MTDDAPLEQAGELVQRVYTLLLEARASRERLTAMAAEGALEAERQAYLGLVCSLEASLLRTLEEAMATLRTMKADEAEAWLRRRLEGLER